MPLTKQQPVDITKKIEDELKVLNEFSENKKTLSISLLDLINSEESKKLINKTANLQKILLKDEDLKIKQAILDLFKEAKNKGLLKQLSEIKEQFEKTNQNKNQINTLINSYKNKHKTDEKIKYIYLRILYKKISIANLVKLKLLTDIIGQNESSVYIKILQNKFSEQGKTGQIAFIHLNNILDPEAEKELRHLADKKSIKRPPTQVIQSELTTIAEPTTTSLPHLKSLSDLSSSSEKNSTSIASQSLDSKHLIEGPSKDKNSKVLNDLLDELNEKNKTIRDLKSSIINLETEIEQLRKQTKQETHPETAVQAGLKSIKSMLYERHNTAHAEELNKKETLIKDLSEKLNTADQQVQQLNQTLNLVETEKANLESKLAQLKQENFELQQKLDQGSANDAHLATLEKEKTTNEKELQELKNKLEKLEEKQTDLKDLSEKLNTADQQVQQLNQTLNLVKTEKANVESKLAQLKQENFELQQKLDQSSANDAHLAALEQEKTSNEKELQELKNNLEKLEEKQTDLKDLSEKLNTADQQVQQLNQTLNLVKTEKANVESKLAQLKQENFELQQKLDQSSANDAHLAALEQEKTSNEKELQELKNKLEKLEEKQTDLKDLSEKLNTADQQVQQLNQTLNLVKTEKANVESKLAQLKQENFELQQKLDQGSANDAHLAALEQEKTSNEKELQELKNKLEKLEEKQTDLKDLSEKLNTADQQVQQLNQTLSLVETEKTNLESKLAQLKQENFELQQKLDQGSANDAHLAALEQEKTSNEKELQELKNKLKNLKEKFKNNQTAYRESKEEYYKLNKAFKKQSQELENLKIDVADAKQFNQQELSNSKKEERSMMNGEVNPPLNNPIYEESDSSHDTKSKVGPAVLSAKDSDSSSGHSSRNSSSSYLNEDEDPLEYTASQQENNPQQPSSSDEAFSDASSNDLQSLHRSASLKSILSEHNLTHLSDGENVSLNETEDELLKNPDSRPSIPAEPTTSISQQQDQDALLHLDPILEKINNGKALSDEEIAKLPSELQYADTIKEFVSGLRVKYPNLASSYENKINGNTFKKTRLILRKNALNALPLAAFEEKEILDLSAKLWLEKKLQHITKKSISLTLDERDQKDLDNNFQKYFRLSYLEDMAITHKSIDELKNELKKLHDFKLKITTELSKAFSEIESKLLGYPKLITEDGSFQANLNNALPLNFPKLSDSDRYPMLSTIQIQILLDKINQHIKNDVSKWSLLNNNKIAQEIANNIISDSTNPFESGTDIQRLVSDSLTILYKRHDLQETLEKRKYWDSEIQQRYALTQKLKSSSHFNQMVEDRISKLEEMLNLKENDADENVKALPKAVYLPNKCRIIPNLQFDSSEDAEKYHLQVDNFYKQDALKVGKTITFSQKLANEGECKWSATLNTDKCLSFKTQKKRFRREKSYLQEVSFAQMVYSVNSFKDAKTCTLNFGNCSQNMKERLYLFAKAYNELRLEDNELQKRPKINCNIKNPPNLDKAKIAAVKEEIKAQLNLHSNELEDISTKLKDDTIRHQIIRSRG